MPGTYFKRTGLRKTARKKLFGMSPGDSDHLLHSALVNQVGTRTVLYVEGRQNLVPIYKRLIEKYGGRFLHHDGGIEVTRSKPPKMPATADVAVCPVDRVSHDACTYVKKCANATKNPLP